MIDVELVKLEDQQVWRDARGIAKEAYHLIDELPEEEKWGMKAKLRHAAFDLTSSLAEAYGSANPLDVEYSFGNARKALFVLKNLYVTGHNIEVMPMDPERVVQIDAAVKVVDKEIGRIRELIRARDKQPDGGVTR